MIKKFIFTLFLLTLALRPLLASIAYPREDIFYSLTLISVSLIFLLLNIRAFPKIKNPLVFFTLLFFFALLLSTAFSIDQEKSLAEFYKYTAYLSVFFACFALSPPLNKTLKLGLLASAITTSILALQIFLGWTLSTFDYLRFNRIPGNFAPEFLSRGRAFMPFSLPADLGGYLIIFIPLAVALLSEKKETRAVSLKNIFALLAVTAASIALLCTQSLGAILSLITSFLILFLKKNGVLSKNTRLGTGSATKDLKPGQRLWTIGLLSSTALGFIIWLRFTNQHVFNLPSFSIANRLSYWSHAMNVIRQHPLTGIGPGNYPFFKGIWIHNAYLQIWAETGVIGFLALLGIAFTILTMDFSRILPQNLKVSQGLWVGTTAFLLHNIVDTTLLHPEVSLQWWATLALLSSFIPTLRSGFR